MATLHNYRQARGLCFKCGEHWGQGHQCAATVQLHIVEELLGLLQAKNQDRQEVDSDSEEEVLMSISKLAMTGQITSCTVRLLGRLGEQEVLILVDSGSSHSFISEQVATKSPSKVQQMLPVSVKIVDGGVLSCPGYIPTYNWMTQGHQFATNLRVLSLGF